MTKSTPQLRLGMTAIAAVLALSSTSVLAQATDGAASQAAPVIVSPPVPVVSSAVTPSIIDAPVASVETVAPQPAMRTVSTPVVHTDPVADAAAATPSRTAISHPVTTRSTRTAPVPAVTPATKTAAQTEVAPAPATAPATTPVARKAAAVPPPVKAPATTAVAAQATTNNDVAPIAGAAGLGLLAIGGLAFAFSRRRRENEDELVLGNMPLEAAPNVAADPIVAVTKAAPKRASAKSTLPNGFDLSRFGRHTQAAYRGPTKDNPSMSLKRRLSRASFFDQREREATEAKTRVKEKHVEPIAARTKAAAPVRDDSQVTIRLAPQRKSTKFGYAFQK